MNKVNFKMVVLQLLLNAHLGWYKHVVHLKAPLARSRLRWRDHFLIDDKGLAEFRWGKTFQDDTGKQSRRSLVRRWPTGGWRPPSQSSQCRHRPRRALLQPSWGKHGMKLPVAWDPAGARGCFCFVLFSLFFFFDQVFCAIPSWEPGEALSLHWQGTS